MSPLATLSPSPSRDPTSTKLRSSTSQPLPPTEGRADEKRYDEKYIECYSDEKSYTECDPNEQTTTVGVLKPENVQPGRKMCETTTLFETAYMPKYRWIWPAWKEMSDTTNSSGAGKASQSI